MTEEKERCSNYQHYIKADGELARACHKHYCLCDDEFKWCNKTNDKYQSAKKEKKARNGIFFK